MSGYRAVTPGKWLVPETLHLDKNEPYILLLPLIQLSTPVRLQLCPLGELMRREVGQEEEQERRDTERLQTGYTGGRSG